MEGEDTNTGRSWGDAFATVTHAVTNAVSGDIIRVSNGLYQVTSEIVVTNAVTVRGENGRDFTVVARLGAQSNRIFRVNQAGAVLDGLTISNGLLNAAAGAGIYLQKGTVRNCRIARNVGDNGNAASGIGVYMSGGVLTNCVVVWNTRLKSSSGDIYGGGIFVTAGKIQNCLIASNSANTGGGIFVQGAALVENCTIVSNYAASFGGGAWVRGGGTIRNCVIRSNRGNCAGVHVGDWGSSYGYAYNCLVESNFGGAGLEIRGTLSTARNCTIVANLNGGARFPRTYEGQMQNSIVYNNTGGDFTGVAGPVSNSCASAFLYSDPSNITDPPRFANPAEGDFSLHVRSPCVDAGTTNVWTFYQSDLRGFPHADGNGDGMIVPDMGCYENPLWIRRGTIITLR
jgi:hypothetical protein